jgi:hypothetical protein
MEEVDRRLSSLCRHQATPAHRRVMDTYDESERANVEGRGTAIVGALRKQKQKGDAEVDYHLLSGSMAVYAGRKPYLVNPFMLVQFPVQYYEDLFGVDVDPEYLVPLLKIWRMEKYCPVEIPSSVWGQFHTKDAYLILWITDKEEKQVREER